MSEQDPISIEQSFQELKAQHISAEQLQLMHIEREQLYTDQQREELAALRAYHKARKTYARCAFWVVCAWLSAILLLIFLQGFKSIAITINSQQQVLYEFHLSDGVLIALISTTTVNIVAFFIIVLNNLFPADPQKAGLCKPK